MQFLEQLPENQQPQLISVVIENNDDGYFI